MQCSYLDIGLPPECLVSVAVYPESCVCMQMLHLRSIFEENCLQSTFVLFYLFSGYPASLFILR